MIARETIDRLRQHTGIVELVGESVKLVRRGRSHVGLCPFHKEKTPSFNVNEERGVYYCFGCHEHGDVFKFVQRLEGLEFNESVRRLAERAGIEVVETASDADRQRYAELRQKQQELYEVLEAAAQFFERMLREHALSSYARKELERRELVAEAPTGEVADALQAFRLGYAPYGWDALANELRTRGLSHRAAEAVGLLVPRKTGSGHYDRFRHRLMFAVIDLQGRVIAFSGRALEEPGDAELAAALVERVGSAQGEAAAKYVNSPESAVYRKREAVFGLYQARQSLRTTEDCVIVEGNFDVVSLHARGLKHVVAPLGTAFTPEQARQIKRFVPTVTLLFDGDAAGRRAVRASRDVCRAASLSAKVATLPDGVDPDELVRRSGPEGVTRVIAAARGMLEYLIESALDASFVADDAHSKTARVREVTELLQSEDDPTVRAMAKRHADQIASRLDIADATTLEALERNVRRALAQPEPPAAEVRPEPPAPPSRARSRDRRDDIGRELLGALFDYPELLEAPETAQACELLEGELALAIAALRQCSSAGSVGDTESILAKLPASIHPFALARLAAPRHVRIEDARTELAGNVRKLKGLELARQKSITIEALQRVAATGDFDQEVALLREQLRRARERHGLGER